MKFYFVYINLHMNTARKPLMLADQIYTLIVKTTSSCYIITIASRGAVVCYIYQIIMYQHIHSGAPLCLFFSNISAYLAYSILY